MHVESLLARALLQSKTGFALVADARGVVMYANDFAEEVLGMPVREIVGQHLSASLFPGGLPEDVVAAMRTEIVWSGAYIHDRAGSPVWLRAAVMPTRDDEGAPFFACIGGIVPEPKTNELQLRDAEEQTPYALHSLDSRGRIVTVNGTWLACMGYERDEVEGKLFFRDVIAPESIPTFLSHWTRFKECGFVRDLEYTFRRKDGTTFPGLLGATAIKDAAGRVIRTRGVFVDISARKHAEAEAALLHQRLVSAIEVEPAPFAIYDAEDRLVLCNNSFRKNMLALYDGPAIGLRFEEILDIRIASNALGLDAAEAAAWKAERLEYQRSPRGSFESRLRDGTVYRTFERRTPEGGTVSVAWDITNDVRREDELAEARRAADAANVAKSEFLSSMSHELRTPLNAVLGFAQLLGREKNPPLSARQLGYLKHVLRGGEHLLKLINEVLDLARVESGNVPISSEPVAVADVLREVLATLGPMAQGKSIELRLSPVPAALPPLLVDRTRFSQILLNYGSNAIKYNRPAGHVTLSAELAPSGAVRVTVADSGIGISLERQQELFQPFRRLGQEAGPVEGTGIGLTIVKRLAEIMGGRVGAQSTPGEGSEFWVEFPAHSTAQTHGIRRMSPPPPSVRAFSAAANTRRYRILYIEDNPQNLVLMEELLATLDLFELIKAPTAEIGFELVFEHPPDIIVLDINLPGMNGYDALELLRSDPRTAKIPVIALSASAMERDIRRAEKAGFSRYLTKPVQLEDLCNALLALSPPDEPGPGGNGVGGGG